VFTASIGSFPEFEDQVARDADKLVVDNWAQNWKRGEFRNLMEVGEISREHLHAELPDIVAGNIPGRESADELIASSLIGIGSIDIGIAWEVYQRAKAQGIGGEFCFL
jgi:ornithine cyclodeaminase/alanine dehydrogenase-like protein (mu-crystallin family)